MLSSLNVLSQEEKKYFKDSKLRDSFGVVADNTIKIQQQCV